MLLFDILSTSQISSLTIILLLLLIALLAYSSLYSTRPPLVHPLLLGKQAETTAVRQKGETGVYRNWGVGFHAPLSTKPAGSVLTVADILKTDCVTRTIFSTSADNALLYRLSQSLLSSLLSYRPLSPSPSPSIPILTLLPPSLPLLLAHLSTSLSTSHHLLTLSSPRFLTPALEVHSPRILLVPSALLGDVLEQIADEESGVRPLVIVVPDENALPAEKSKAQKELEEQAKRVGNFAEVVGWAEVLRKGMGGAVKVDGEAPGSGSDEKPGPADIHAITYLEFPSDSHNSHKPLVLTMTNENLLSGLSSFLSLFPPSLRPSAQSNDVLASSESMLTPFGLVQILAAVFTGSGYKDFGRKDVWGAKEEDVLSPDFAESSSPLMELTSLMKDPSKPPTLLFCNTNHLSALSLALLKSSCSHPLYDLAIRHKEVGLAAGTIGRDGVLYKWVLEQKGVAGGVSKGLRAVFVMGEAPSPNTLRDAILHLSLPISRLFSSPYSTGAIFATHFFDLQTPAVKLAESDKEPTVHVGPPASNIEVVLKGAGVEKLEEGGNPVGQVWVRGPGVMTAYGEKADVERWTDLGKTATIQPNGVFCIHPDEGPR